MSRLPFDAFDMADVVDVRIRRSWEQRQPRQVEPASTPDDQRRVIRDDWRTYVLMAFITIVLCALAAQWGLEVAAP